MSDETDLSHVSPEGAARMVDVGGKKPTRRSATAEAWVAVGKDIAGALKEKGHLAKGNVLETARVAGIMAAKRTPELIPMCHPLPLDVVEISADIEGGCVRLVAQVACEAKTGAEMEAMTAASVAALTVYDMVKSASREVEIGPIRLLAKCGGKSGTWCREESDTTLRSSSLRSTSGPDART